MGSLLPYDFGMSPVDIRMPCGTKSRPPLLIRRTMHFAEYVQRFARQEDNGKRPEQKDSEDGAGEEGMAEESDGFLSSSDDEE